MATPSSDREEAALTNFGAGGRFTPSTPITPEAAAAAAAAAAGGVRGGPSPYAQQQRRGLTLADIRRRNLDEQQALRDVGHLKRYRFLNYSSEDTQFQNNNSSKLETLYCSCCGANACISELPLASMPRRETDAAHVLQVGEIFHKLYLLPSKRIILRRPTGLEVQYQLKCRDCGVAIAYRCTEGGDTPEFVYFYPDTLCTEQSDAYAWQGH